MTKREIIYLCSTVIGHYYSMANGVIESDDEWDDSMKTVEDIHKKMDEELEKLKQRTTAIIRNSFGTSYNHKRCTTLQNGGSK